MSDDEIGDRLAHYNIPCDPPLVVQVSRFDKWKDPQGVIDAFRSVRKQLDCTLVLVRNVATDDAEGQDVFASLCRCADERLRILSVQDSALVNALQRRGGRGSAEVDSGRFRPHRHRGHVERNAGRR